MKAVPLYWRSRVVHINVNAMISGILSIILSIHFVYLTRYFTDHRTLIALISYAIDGLIDFGIFSLLHLFIYKRHIHKLSHIRMLASDLAVLQTHRVFLAVVTFVTSAGLHWVLMHLGFKRTIAFVIAYSIGLVLTRIIHTQYGIKSGLFKPLKLEKLRT